MKEALVELVFMMVILKLPIVYLCGVVWWALKAEPRPLDGAALTLDPEPVRPRCPWRRPGPGPSSGPRRASRRARGAHRERTAP